MNIFILFKKKNLVKEVHKWRKRRKQKY